jgi:Ca2+/H+ antiporter, TMEM165/GDT1 family
MNRSRFPRFLFFLLFLFAFIVPLSFIIMALWNNILVAVLHVSVINFWQALGLFALSRILFGGFPHKPAWAGHHRHRGEMQEMRNKWFNLSPEEKKHFREDWKTGFDKGKMPGAPDPAVTE